MSTSSINPLANSALESILSSALQNTTPTTKSTSTAPVGQSADTGQLSPLGQLMSTLQQLQQSDPSKYQQVTQEIASNLQTAAQSAQSGGNTAAATQLNQLSTDFTNASKSGQLPTVQNFAQAVGGGHHGHHGHHSHSASSGSDASSSASTTPTTASTTTPSTPLSQFMSSLQANAPAPSDALNPLSIIQKTLTSAGITGSNS